jgi:hypothetical protein
VPRKPTGNRRTSSTHPLFPNVCTALGPSQQGAAATSKAASSSRFGLVGSFVSVEPLEPVQVEPGGLPYAP